MCKKRRLCVCVYSIYLRVVCSGLPLLLIFVSYVLCVCFSHSAFNWTHSFFLFLCIACEYVLLFALLFGMELFFLSFTLYVSVNGIREWFIVRLTVITFRSEWWQCIFQSQIAAIMLSLTIKSMYFTWRNVLSMCWAENWRRLGSR